MILSANDGSICDSRAKYIDGHLLPHPFDQAKFYICQNVGKDNVLGSLWKSHLMHCPDRTCFSSKYNKCVWIEKNSECVKA